MPGSCYKPFFLAAFLVALAPGQKAADPKPADKGINKSEIQALYFSGEFEPLIALLENLRHQRRLRDREDSVFIFKYLGVVYGADETTRKKAESFLFQLLKLNPKADLADMGVGDNIESLFRRVRDRYDKTYRDSTFDRQREIILRQWAADSLKRDSLRRAEKAAAAPEAAPAESAAEATAAVQEKKGDNRRVWLWAAAGGAAAVTATALIFALSGEPEAKVDTVLTPLR